MRKLIFVDGGAVIGNTDGIVFERNGDFVGGVLDGVVNEDAENLLKSGLVELGCWFGEGFFDDFWLDSLLVELGLEWGDELFDVIW